MKSEVYRGVEIVARKYTKSGTDYALVRLDRPVEGHKPLVLASEDADKHDTVYVMGHPSGLPIKYAGGAHVLSSWGFNPYFKANLDTYGGNSGSPVFNADHEVVGILVRGDTDFISVGDCVRSLVIPKVSFGGKGEAVTKVSQFRKFVPAE